MFFFLQLSGLSRPFVPCLFLVTPGNVLLSPTLWLVSSFCSLSVLSPVPLCPCQLCGRQCVCTGGHYESLSTSVEQIRHTVVLKIFRGTNQSVPARFYNVVHVHDMQALGNKEKVLVTLVLLTRSTKIKPQRD